jgi:hypothetical protein
MVAADALTHKSTDELKQELIDRVHDRDGEALGKKVAFAKTELMPWFDELSRRNPFPNAIDQIDLVVGVWSPVWSTIPCKNNWQKAKQTLRQIFKSSIEAPRKSIKKSFMRHRNSSIGTSIATFDL